MPPPNIIDLSDISEINESYLRYIRSLDGSELQRRTEEVAVRDMMDTGELTRQQEILDEFGIVVIPDVVADDVCAKVAAAANQLYDDYAARQSETFEDERALFQIGSAILKGYHQLSSYGKAVISVRKGQDEGMVDIFNCDLSIGSPIQEIRAVFENRWMSDLLNNAKLRARNLNVYLNRSVVATRGFHVDSYSRNLKAFVYLSDVLSLDDGPYTFVKGSHGETAYRRANQYLCSEITPATEHPIVDPLAITPILARRGSMVVSDQAGSHRGWPQAVGHDRTVAVMKYS